LEFGSVRIGFKIYIYYIFGGNRNIFLIILPLAGLAIELLLYLLILLISIMLIFNLLNSNYK